MTLAASVITTFPVVMWDVYAKQMLTSFCTNWPVQIPILVVLDDDKLIPDVQKIIRPQDAVAVFKNADREAFLMRNAGKDDKDNYRKQALRFCHKVFAIKDAADYWQAYPDDKTRSRYLIWLDADVLTTRQVIVDEIQKCLPKEGDAVAYMGRKDWPHSECGWLAFDLQNGAPEIINQWVDFYKTDKVFSETEWHDSWLFDRIEGKKTNLTEGRPGMDIWPQSPMAAWSRHYKGPVAKQELVTGKPAQQVQKQIPIHIQTQNSRPNEELQKNILENQAQIPPDRWLRKCLPNDEEIVVVSAGPMLVAEDVQPYVDKGYKIVAVKHALKPLKEAGITPWACILLDPREHVYDFVEHPDPSIKWFVASQVTPRAVKKLLDSDCEVWGYHAAVGAEEDKHTDRQPVSVVSGGSATATRGLFLLDMLGFRKFILLGYDLCLPRKPDMSEKDQFGQPKHFEMSWAAKSPLYKAERDFYMTAELVAQAQEFQHIAATKPEWKITAHGHGVIPFLWNAKRVQDLRALRKNAKMGVGEPVHYRKLLGCKNKTRLWGLLPMKLPSILHRPRKESSF